MNGKSGDSRVFKKVSKRYVALQFMPKTRRDFSHAERVSSQVEEIDLQADRIEPQRILPKPDNYSFQFSTRSTMILDALN